MAELAKFRNKVGLMQDPSVLEAAKELPSYTWWELYGSDFPLLRLVAIKVTLALLFNILFINVLFIVAYWVLLVAHLRSSAVSYI
jgi:hypothetical protein